MRRSPRKAANMLAWFWSHPLALTPLIALSAGFLIVVPGDWAAGVFVALVWAATLFARTRRLMHRVDADLASKLFLLGLCARAVAGLVVWGITPRLGYEPRLWFPDGMAFDIMSQRLALDFEGLPIHVVVPRPEYASIAFDAAYVNVYSRFYGFVYVLFGYQPLLPIAVNWVLGSLAAVFVFGAARQLVSVRAALAAGMIASFVPSVFLWSLFNLREAALTCVAAMAVWAVPTIANRNSWLACAIGFAALLVFERLRFYAGVPAMCLAFAVVGLPMTRKLVREHALAVPALTFMSVALIVPTFFGGLPLGVGWALSRGREDLADVDIFTNPERAAAQATAQATSTSLTATAIAVANLSTPTAAATPKPTATPTPTATPVAQPPLPASDDFVGLILWQRGELAAFYSQGGNRTLFVNPVEATTCLTLRCIPEVIALGVPHVLFAPLPWDMTATRDLLTLPELPVWYGGVVMSLVAVALRARAWREWIYAALSTCCIVLVLSLFDVNSGTVLRHRSMLLPGLLVLSAVGVSALRDHLPRRVTAGRQSRAVAVG